MKWVYVTDRWTDDTGFVSLTHTVGFYDPAGKWHPDSDWPTRDEAAARCNYLNGGHGKQGGRVSD